VQPESATAVCLVLDAADGGRATELRQSGVVVELFFNFIVIHWLSFGERSGRSTHLVFFCRLVLVVPALGAALRTLVPDLAAMCVAVVSFSGAGTRVGVVRGVGVGIIPLAVALGKPVEFGVGLG
jgi:hypothetical protein